MAHYTDIHRTNQPPLDSASDVSEYGGGGDTSLPESTRPKYLGTATEVVYGAMIPQAVLGAMMAGKEIAVFNQPILWGISFLSGVIGKGAFMASFYQHDLYMQHLEVKGLASWKWYELSKYGKGWPSYWSSLVNKNHEPFRVLVRGKYRTMPVLFSHLTTASILLTSCMFSMLCVYALIRFVPYVLAWGPALSSIILPLMVVVMSRFAWSSMHMNFKTYDFMRGAFAQLIQQGCVRPTYLIENSRIKRFVYEELEKIICADDSAGIDEELNQLKRKVDAICCCAYFSRAKVIDPPRVEVSSWRAWTEATDYKRSIICFDVLGRDLYKLALVFVTLVSLLNMFFLGRMTVVETYKYSNSTLAGLLSIFLAPGTGLSLMIKGCQTNLDLATPFARPDCEHPAFLVLDTIYAALVFYGVVMLTIVGTGFAHPHQPDNFLEDLKHSTDFSSHRGKKIVTSVMAELVVLWGALPNLYVQLDSLGMLKHFYQGVWKTFLGLSGFAGPIILETGVMIELMDKMMRKILPTDCMPIEKNYIEDLTDDQEVKIKDIVTRCEAACSYGYIFKTKDQVRHIPSSRNNYVSI